MIFLCVGTDKPTVKLLNIYVKDKVTPKWYDLGVQLLSTEQSCKLDIIKLDHPNDTTMCCTEMFKYWLDVDVDASWNKLIAALEQIDQNTLAKNISSNVSKGFEIIGMYTYMHILIQKHLQSKKVWPNKLHHAWK